MGPLENAAPRSVAGAAPGAGGGLADMLGATPEVSLAAAFPRVTLVKIAVLAGLLVGLYLWQIDRLVANWADPNWLHGYIIPLFSLYLLYSRREELAAAPRRICLPGLGLMALSFALQVLLVFAQVPGFVYLMQLCMLGMVFGLVLYLGGPAVIRITWLPILFLLFALPIPDSLYTQISLPLQNLSAKGAVVILRVFGVGITADASRLDLVSRARIPRTLTVAEACSGMHLLMAFLALGVAMAYLDYKPLWQRVILVLAAIPIAIFCNVLRVAITCSMYYFDNEELGKGFMHTFTGLLMLIPAFLLLWLLALLLKSLFVEEEEKESPNREASA